MAEALPDLEDGSGNIRGRFRLCVPGVADPGARIEGALARLESELAAPVRRRG